MFLTFRDLTDVNGPNLFAMSFIQEIEYCEKKKSMKNAKRQELGPTMWDRKLTAWWGVIRFKRIYNF
jgi:hypothetical protein